MFKKLHLLATARRLNDFTVEELANAAEVPVGGVKAVISRLPSTWYETEPPTSGGHSSIRFKLSEVGETAIASQLDREFDNPYENHVDADYEERTSFLVEERLKLSEKYALSDPDVSSHFRQQSQIGLASHPTARREVLPDAPRGVPAVRVTEKYNVLPKDQELVRGYYAASRPTHQAPQTWPLVKAAYQIPVQNYLKPNSVKHCAFLEVGEAVVSGSYLLKNTKVDAPAVHLSHMMQGLYGRDIFQDFDSPIVESVGLRRERVYQLENARAHLLNVLLVSLDHHGSTVKLAKIAEQCAAMARELGNEPIKVQTIEYDRLKSPSFSTSMRGQFDKIILCGNSSQREAQRKASKIIKSSILDWIAVHFIDVAHNSAFEESIKSSPMHYSRVDGDKVYRAILDAMTAKRASAATPQIGWK